MGKYNSKTKAITAGGGISGILGPLIFGYARYKDQTQLSYEEDTSLVIPAYKRVFDFDVETLSAGFYLGSLIVDYSVLRRLSAEIPSTVDVLTGTLLVKKFILTASLRSEDSNRPVYDAMSQTLVYTDRKKEVFAGVQYRVFPFMLVGIFQNYYLMHELSLGATVFF